MMGITFLLHSQACALAGARNTFERITKIGDERRLWAAHSSSQFLGPYPQDQHHPWNHGIPM